MNKQYPALFHRIVGPLPDPGRLPDEHRQPFDSVEPALEGFVERDGVRIAYAVWGDAGPWLAFPPPYQIGHMRMHRSTVPYLSRYFRVVTMDGRGNGRSDRPRGQAAYSFDHYYGDFVAVLDAIGAERVALVGISAASLTVLRLAAEQPQRVSHLDVVGGMPHSRLDDPAIAERVRADIDAMRADWPAYLATFMQAVLPEPHSTKAIEDGVRHGWATDAEVLEWVRRGWLDADCTEHARRVGCPTLVVHGDNDRRVPHAMGRLVHALVPGAQMLTISGGGHLPSVRDPAWFNRTLRDFVLGAHRPATWTRAMSRRRRALFISSPIGLGHVQRDLAIARELRRLQPDLEIAWFTTDPAARYLQHEGETLHPAAARLANESRHFEQQAGDEHDLHAFFALRQMDEIMVRNFMVFSDLMEDEHFDLVIGDEAWDVDYYYHERPELKRQPFVFLTDFVGCLPMKTDDEREAFLCADRNADDLEHVARFPYVRDMALFVGNREDVTEQPFGPGLPGIRAWTDRNFAYSGYALPFDPAAYADTEALRARLGYRRDERVVIAAVGGTAVGEPLLHKIAASSALMRRQLPGLRMILVAGPRMAPAALARLQAADPGLEVRSYVHNLFEHLACCDLALVQGGLSTCMELVALKRPFLSFPLRHHFEQCVHVRRRLANYCADCALDYASLTLEVLADKALGAMHAPVRYRPVETDGAARAARRIAEVLENRRWVQ